MTNRKPTHDNIGFEESTLLKFIFSEDHLLIFLERWNGKILRLEFKECIMFQMFTICGIEDLCEADTSELFEKALQIYYDKVPQDHGFKLYQFMDFDEPIIEITCKNLSILEVDMIS